MSARLKLPGLKKNILLAPYTTYKIGGPADYFVTVHNQDELVQAVIAARQAKVPYFLLGTGANILIGDQGFRGLVILNQAKDYKFHDHELTASSGAVMANLIEGSAQRGLSGIEHFIGIPSSVGGAIWQNLHFASVNVPAWHKRQVLQSDRTIFIAEVVKSAKILDEQNNIREVDASFFQFGYDDSVLHHHSIVVLEVTLQLTPKDPQAIRAQTTANMAWRNAVQPQLWEFASCGSIFKKIEGVGAGRLIDQSGLKGKTIGNVQVSRKHANYLINLGGATAQEVRELIALVQSEVQAKTGYHLEPEISFVGEF